MNQPSLYNPSSSIMEQEEKNIALLIELVAEEKRARSGPEEARQRLEAAKTALREAERACEQAGMIAEQKIEDIRRRRLHVYLVERGQDLDVGPIQKRTPIRQDSDVIPSSLSVPATQGPRTPSRQTATVPVLWSLLPQAPTITFNGTDWVELRCFRCRGNARFKHHTFLKGPQGFRAHIQLQHPGELDDVSIENIAKVCTFRTVSEYEVRRIKSWTEDELPIDMVLCSGPSSGEHKSDRRTAHASPAMTPDPLVAEMTKKLPSCVVRRNDGVWVELRCPVCGRNTSTSRFSHGFLQGIAGFCNHIRQVHPSKEFQRDEWDAAIDYCTFREFTDREVEDIANNRPGAPTIRHIQYTPANEPSQGASRSRKRKREISESSRNESVSPSPSATTDGEEVVHAHGNNLDRPGPYAHTRSALGTPKIYDDLASRQLLDSFSHARKPPGVANESDSIPQSRKDSMGETQGTSPCNRQPNDTRASPSASTAGATRSTFEGFCPCTLTGHLCRSESCGLEKLCLSSNHDDDCRSRLVHQKPSCVKFMLVGCENGDICVGAHDLVQERKRVFFDHKCDSH